TADSAWAFVLWIALAAFCNDLTMGSAWASCIDIGGKYAGIVSGCMNTIGNLGGAVAGVTTGAILDWLGKGPGWQVNFASFGLLYAAAVVLWLNFDATKMVAQSRGEKAVKLDLEAPVAPGEALLPGPPREDTQLGRRPHREDLHPDQ